jgi:peptidylprolyl isomerase
MVVEVLDGHEMVARGASLALPWGFPALTENEAGRPGIVLPPQAPPSEQRVAAAISGSGAEVGPDDYMIGNVLTVGWNDGRVRENTWESSLVEIGSESQTTAYAFRPALTGQTVGSRVVVLDPNDGDPVVHVVDIIAVG